MLVYLYAVNGRAHVEKVRGRNVSTTHARNDERVLSTYGTPPDASACMTERVYADPYRIPEPWEPIRPGMDELPF